MNTFYRTTLCTLAAVGTFFRINVCTVVIYGDCAEFTNFFALLTSDTAIGADLAGICAFVVAHAGNVSSLASWKNFQNTVWTSFRTSSASDTQIFLYLCNMIDNLNCIIFTGIDTVAITQAGKVTACSSVIEEFCSLTGFWTIIIHDVFGSLKMSAASYYCTFWLDGTNRYAEDFAKFCSNSCTADWTEVWLCFASNLHIRRHHSSRPAELLLIL